MSAQYMDIVRTKDTGTLQYDIYFNDDQSELHRPRAVRGLRGALEHTARLGDMMDAILATGSVPASFWVSRASSSERSWQTAPVCFFTPFLSR